MSAIVTKQIQEALAAGKNKSISRDQLFGTDGGNVYQDLQTTLGVAPLEGLRRLEIAFRDQRVIRRAYCDDHSGGCLVFHLFGVTNNDQLVDIDLSSVDTGFTIYRTIQAWDRERLSQEVVEHFLQQELETRACRPESCFAIRKERERS